MSSLERYPGPGPGPAQGTALRARRARPSLARSPSPGFGRTGSVRVEPLESLVILLGLLLSMGTFNALLVGGGEERSESSGIFALVASANYALALAFFMRTFPRDVLTPLVRSWPLLALVGFAVLSVLWSSDPTATLRRGIALGLTTTFAFYAAVKFETEKLLQLIYVSFFSYMAVQVGAVFAFPDLAVHQGDKFDGAWRGLGGMKNDFGRSLGLMFVLFVALRNVGDRFWYRISLLGAAASFVLLLLSTARTPLAGAIGALGLSYLVMLAMGRPFFGDRFRLSPTLGTILAITGLSVAGVLIVLVAPTIILAMGKDLTLSGRTGLWEWAISKTVESKPWIGLGYRAFWVDENTKYFFEDFAWGKGLDGELSDSYSGPSHSHSGFVDTFVELGYIGCALLALTFVTALRHTARTLRQGELAIAAPLCALTMYILVYSFAARGLLQQTFDIWLIFMMFIFMASVGDQSRRVR